MIDYIVKAYALHESLTDEQIFLLDKCFRIISDNQEFTKTTLDQLLDFFYFSLHFEPIEFNRDKRRGYMWGGWYDIPTKDRDLAAKKLNNRKKKRRRYIDESWYKSFNESFDWESLHDIDKQKEGAKELMLKALGPGRVEEIRENRDPRSAVIVPFKKQ